MKFTPEQQKENLREAIKDLRENPKKARGQMRDEDGGRCCLCVMVDTAKRITGRDFYGDYMPKPAMKEVFGFNFREDKLIIDGQEAHADTHNDGLACEKITEKSHKEIADALETQFLR